MFLIFLFSSPLSLFLLECIFSSQTIIKSIEFYISLQ
nr:MAG TPA: hypothetical protein [Caudoviricetes sp.]